MSAKPDLVLHHAPRTRSLRVRWLLEEMGLPYRLEQVAFDKRPIGDEAFGEISPLRKVPALSVDGRVITESTAMLELLTTRFGPTELAVTPDESDFDLYLQWIHFAEGTFGTPLNMLIAHTIMLPEAHRSETMAAWGKSECDRFVAYIGEHGLKDREWLAGDRFTCADIAIGYPLFILRLLRVLGDAPEGVKDYAARLFDRPAWKRASAD